MPKPLTRIFEVLLILVVIAAVLFGATWLGSPPIDLRSSAAQPQADAAASLAATPIPSADQSSPTVDAASITASTPQTTDAATTVSASTALSLPSAAIATPLAFDPNFSADEIAPGDAPLLQQAEGTINFLLLGSDASADSRFARTDSLIIASVNPEIPSVSMLSLPRDLHVRIPGFGTNRINTAFEFGNQSEYPGGGARFLALVLRKNFGIRIDHFVRIDFQGFIKAIDTLGGVEVLAECELHDTFPDPTNPRRGIDLDVMPGKISLTGQQALWYSRSRWNTSDFDRARRQQKVLRAVLRKARQSNLLQNAVGLFSDFRNNIETNIGITDLPAFVDIARRLDDLTIKNRVITFPVVKSVTRADGAMVLEPQPDILAYVAEALAPPTTNRVQTRPGVEVYNASARPDMELVAAERLTWEGFLVVDTSTLSDTIPTTQIFDFTTTTKGSPITRLRSIFSVSADDVIGQADPSSPAAARIVLGADYQSCPDTYRLAADVVTQPASGALIPTATPAQPAD
jgi:LCP family protein required for cell wall assembly